MSAIPRPMPAQHEPEELHSGDRMTQEEFHRIYQRMPKHFKAELIGGIVYVASPLRIKHGRNHLLVGGILLAYEFATPGVEASDNTTIILNEDSEPQPDLYLRVLPEYGGQSQTSEDDYVVGAPELIVEVAHSSRSLDLNAKRTDYARYGVKEYLVISVRDRELRWFAGGRELKADADGICKIQNFPGLWIDAPAVIDRDFNRSISTLQRGLATSEHADFVARLAATKR